MAWLLTSVINVFTLYHETKPVTRADQVALMRKNIEKGETYDRLRGLDNEGPGDACSWGG